MNVVDVITQRIEQAIENMAITDLLDPPFCDVDYHRADIAGMIYICRDCGEILERRP